MGYIFLSGMQYDTCLLACFWPWVDPMVRPGGLSGAEAMPLGWVMNQQRQYPFSVLPRIFLFSKLYSSIVRIVSRTVFFLVLSPYAEQWCEGKDRINQHIYQTLPNFFNHSLIPGISLGGVLYEYWYSSRLLVDPGKLLESLGGSEIVKFVASRTLPDWCTWRLQNQRVISNDCGRKGRRYRYHRVIYESHFCLSWHVTDMQV